MKAILNSQVLLETIYLIAAMLFILSLKWLSSPASARRGVRAGEIGMLLAVVGTLLHHGIVDYTWIAIGLVLGTVIGVPLGGNDSRAQRTALSRVRRWAPPRWHSGLYLRGPAVRNS
jgi:NAD(P) transhydrogenase subunit beta